MKMIPAMASAIEVWPVDRLIPYAANARTHSDAQVDKVAASIKEFGFTSPILVDGKDGIIAGHCRLMAARKLGMEQVPVIILDHLSDAQRRAYILADNRLALDSGWDNDILAAELDRLREDGYDLEVIGFSDEELGGLLDGMEEQEESGGDSAEEKIPPPHANPVSRPGDLWILGEHRLLCGDSTKAEDVMRLMNGERAVLFATDPPYLVDYTGGNHPPSRVNPATGKRRGGGKDWTDTYGKTWDDADQGPELYQGYMRQAIDHAIDDHAAWYCWHASKRQAMVEAVWEEMGAFVHQTIIWNKNTSILSRTHYLWKHEPCFFGWMRGNRPPRLEGSDNCTTVWDLKSLAGDERPEHPTPKPLECFGIPMRQHVEKGGLCYEPFSGGGSQIMAGEANHRRVYAMEISPVYVDVAVQRFIQATGKIVYLDGSGGKTFAEVAAERGIVLDVAGDA
ncbi:MAG: ParB N-terminal domain-containing protein [Magnetococcales bacterium]|nr:ParB N-terminal domain-containing protein [Magnetococcales bacterium]